jgi:SAM-dependent methyltransferase
VTRTFILEVGSEMRKRYDKDYFDAWYRGPGQAVGSAAALRRNVALAVAVTESVLARPLRSVLDVGCGEGRWQPVLRKLRPNATYLGIDSSEYAVERYGRRRNLRLGSFEELELHVFDQPFDLVVCSDVLHYLTPEQIRQGLPRLVDLTGGAALLEVFTSADEIEGDDLQFFRRAPAWYLDVFRRAGLRPVGLQMYVPEEVAEVLDAMDLPD